MWASRLQKFPTCLCERCLQEQESIPPLHLLGSERTWWTPRLSLATDSGLLPSMLRKDATEANDGARVDDWELWRDLAERPARHVPTACSELSFAAQRSEHSPSSHADGALVEGSDGALVDGTEGVCDAAQDGQVLQSTFALEAQMPSSDCRHSFSKAFLTAPGEVLFFLLSIGLVSRIA